MDTKAELTALQTLEGRILSDHRKAMAHLVHDVFRNARELMADAYRGVQNPPDIAPMLEIQNRLIDRLDAIRGPGAVHAFYEATLKQAKEKPKPVKRYSQDADGKVSSEVVDKS